MASLKIVGATVVVLIALFAAYIYLFGIPPEVKRQMEEKALETMGENKASYLTKDMLSKVPDSDQKVWLQCFILSWKTETC